MSKQAYNPIGGVVTTNSSKFNVINTNKYGTEYAKKYRKVYNLVFKNIGTQELIFKINDGEKMPLSPNQSFSCGEYEVKSFMIYTNGAKIQFSGFINEPYREEV